MTDDVFEGTWTANSEDSQWDVRNTPKPQQACVRFEATETGYLMVAYGIVDGKAVAERPQAISTDGRRRPLLDLNGRPIPGVPSGAVAFASRSDSQTLEGGAEVDGTVLSAGTYKVSADAVSIPPERNDCSVSRHWSAASRLSWNVGSINAAGSIAIRKR